jgi:hypothetical protein
MLYGKSILYDILIDVRNAVGPTYFIFSPEVFSKGRAMETIFNAPVQFVMIDEGRYE